MKVLLSIGTSRSNAYLIKRKELRYSMLNTSTKPMFEPIKFALRPKEDIEIVAIKLSALWIASEVPLDGFFQPKVFAKEDSSFFIKTLSLLEKWKAQLSNSMGFYDRCGARLSSQPYDWTLRRESILLTAVKKSSPCHIIGVVEIGLELPNASITPPVRTWADQNADIAPMEPYLSNLAVLSIHRGKGIGSYLTEACEELVGQLWKKNCIYLHVHEGNKKAIEMYKRHGYYMKQIVEADESSGHEKFLYLRKDL